MKRFCTTVVAICILLAALPAAADTDYAALKKGDYGESVRLLQTRLKELGFLTGKADGDYGSATEDAVRWAQRLMEGVSDTGVADSETQGRLFDASFVPYAADLAEGDSGEAVALLQNRLAQLGYMTEGASKHFDKLTVTALAGFQAASGLAESGVLDAISCAALYAPDAKHSDEVNLRVLKRKDAGPGVEKLQRALIYYGFLSGEPDGSFGKDTEDAVLACGAHMAAQGLLSESGPEASVEMQQILLSGSYNPHLNDLRAGDAGAEVKWLQARLFALKYADLAPTGSFGEYTTDCLRLFQRAAGLPASGVADKESYARLYAQDAPPAESYVRRTLAFGSAGDTVSELQERLLTLGFLSPYPSAQYDARTRDALGRMLDYLRALSKEDDAFAWANGYTLSEGLSPIVQARILFENWPVYREDVKHGSSGAETYRVQRRLYTLLYIKAESVSGKAGAVTQKAVEAFQQNNALPVTGVADSETQELLFSEGAVSGGTHYVIRVSIRDQMTRAYERGPDGHYTLVREMECSTGTAQSPTPPGVYYNTYPQDRWHYFAGFRCWAQYSSVFYGPYMFHSVLYGSKSERSVNGSTVRKLGNRASHGCVRLSVEDAKWVFEHMEKGTIVIVQSG